MVHPGFEPPTARFVAEVLSIRATDASGKLLYCRFFDTAGKPYQVRDGASGRIRTPTARFVAEVLYQLKATDANGG